MGQHDAGAFLDSAIICASYVLVNISRDLNNSSVLISSLRAHARFIDLVIDSIIDLAQLLPNYCKAQTNY